MKKKLLLFNAIFISFFSLFAQVPIAEREALMAFYDSTKGFNWTNRTGWNTTDPVSTWYGIATSIIDGQEHVTEINFGSNNIEGVLPAEIGNLPELKVLSIESNNLLSGNIPDQIGNLVNLEILSFWENNLSGSIPASIGNCTKLELFSLEDNQLTGSIPAEFSNLTMVNSLWLNGNLLSGDIPDIFSGWTELDYLSIGKGNLNPENTNSFTGILDLSNNSKLRICRLDYTMISKLNLQNGNNMNMVSNLYDAIGTSKLTCVFVDDVAYSEANWTNTDPASTFVATEEECDALIQLSVTKQSIKENIALYPNPTSGILYIKNQYNEPIDRVTVFNTLGQRVLDIQAVNTIDISNLTNGLYFVDVTTRNGNMNSFKIIKK